MALDASSTETPRNARSATCSSYADPDDTACAKIVGLEVTPTTWKSSISDRRFPVRSRSRLMSSSQTETPASDSCPSTSDMVIDPSLLHRRRRLPAAQYVLCHGGYPLGGEAKL